MCEFCHSHGDGQKWYLKAENYSAELLNDLERRRYFEEFLPQAMAAIDLKPRNEHPIARNLW